MIAESCLGSDGVGKATRLTSARVLTASQFCHEPIPLIASPESLPLVGPLYITFPCSSVNNIWPSSEPKQQPARNGCGPAQHTSKSLKRRWANSGVDELPLLASRFMRVSP